MTDLIIMAGVALASAGVGTVLTWLSFRGRRAWERDVTDAAYGRWSDLADRHVRALHHIPPYKRGANGSLQKIGKILRGEED